MKISAQLIAKLHQIRRAFYSKDYVATPVKAAPQMPDLSDWEKLLKEAEESGGGGGGGTARGLRGKNHANAVRAAKEQMRRLGRK